MKLLKRIGLVMLIVLVGLQFIPTRSNQSKEVGPSTDFVQTFITREQKITNGLFDCATG